ncbi:MAG: hypothetical protein MZV63_44600 [Marinilabiliales bacterium]|nr:hypothetical protein [Marinilabiliales bacterium]
MFLLAQDNGVFVVKYVNGSFLSIGKINGISQSIINMAEDTDGSLWLACKNNDLYSIYPFDEFNTDLSFDYFPASTNVLTNPDWISLCATQSGVLFSTSNGVFRYNKTASVFYPDSLLTSITENSPTSIFPIMEDHNQNLWVNLVDQKTLNNKTLIIENKNGVFSSTLLNINRNNDFLITSMYSDSSGLSWIGGLDRLVSINTYLGVKEKDSVLLFFNKITINQDSVIHNLYGDLFTTSGKTEYKPIIIDHTYNTLRFEFTSPEFSSENLVQFCYILDGYDKTWTNWSIIHSKEYKNLPEGKYTFRVKAKNIFSIESPEINFRFVIRPPFYRSTLAYIIYILFITFIVLVAIRWRAYYFARERFKLENIINERTEEVVIQKEKAENLLERVLPKTTATELKSGKKAGPYHYNMVTVLFSDIQGFTKISEQLDSEMLIDELDKFFLKFDSVVDKFNIEKIKTIGDAYMCAGGIPEKNRTNPVEVVLAAIEMQNYMKHLKHEKGDGTQRIWDLRIGIDTGPVVAGVLGKSKITYDIWGGTVNTASRMEAAGEPGKINVTENTYLLIKEFFICQYRGKMPVKHKGELDMYFVESFMPHLASDIKGLYPNDNFFTQLQLLRLNDIEEFILTKLEEDYQKTFITIILSTQ